MSDLDYYSLGRLLDATIQPISPPVFGSFGVLPLVAETAKSRLGHGTPKSRFTVQQERTLARSFERSRDGLPPDALLWNTQMRDTFVKTCKKNGLDFPPPDLVRRLLSIRKNPKRYSDLGIVLARTTKREEHTGLLTVYAPAIEFALVRLRYLHGCSIDEILIDWNLGNEFEKTVNSVVPNLSSQSMRQAALTLRKTRFLAKSRRTAFKKMDLQRLKKAWSDFSCLDSINLCAIPAVPGIVEIREPQRELYISRNENLQAVMQLLSEKQAVSIMANEFWQPSPRNIQARYLPEAAIKSADLERWELKLLSEENPIFNWPIAKPKRAA
jgi:hypothetical protein